MSPRDDNDELETPETMAHIADEGPSVLNSFEQFFLGHIQEQRRERGDRPAFINKFRVDDELGAGTFGRVYRVYDPDLDCFRAAKVPTAMVLSKPELRGEFLREARNLQKIDDHPNVVRVVQAGDDDGNGNPYFVMEYCRDRSLAHWLRHGDDRPMDEKWAARLVAQIADGVHRIHQQQLCHRDLKPGNILLVQVGEGGDPDRPDFRPKVADFGLASVLDDPEATASIMEGPIGTAAYMAPEQLRGHRKEIGPASDVYGLGAILFEVVSGRRAYGSASKAEIFEALQSDLPSPSLKVAYPKASRAMTTIVDTAMRKEARYRYESAAAMADDLRLLADGRAVRGTSRSRKVFYFLSQHRNAIAGLVIVGAVAGVAGEARKIQVERRHTAAAAWLETMKTALPAEVASLTRKQSPTDPLVAEGLAVMFASDDPVRKLNAAVALAALQPVCADHVVDRLLTLPPQNVGPIARAVAPAIPDLLPRLSDEANPHSPKVGEPALARSRRRANASLALFVLGSPRRGCAVLGDLSDPSARSLLVHAIGPAGVPPWMVVDLLADPEMSLPIRRQLLLAVGEIPKAAWDLETRSRAENLAFSLYENNPDAGIHGAAKWLLKTWNLEDRMAALDKSLVRREARPGFGWRVDASGLTFVTVSRAEHRFEISDTEVPTRLYLQFNPKLERQIHNHWLIDDDPVLDVTFLDAVAFANWFNERDGRPLAYGRVVDANTLPIASDVVRTGGYRLPTTGEFVVAAEANTTTNCYFGDEHEIKLINHYAFTADTLQKPWVQPVGLLKPNDFGLFDMIGNALDMCQFDGPLENGPKNQLSSCGGSGILPSRDLKAGQRKGDPSSVEGSFIPSGFRLTRTLGAAAGPPL